MALLFLVALLGFAGLDAGLWMQACITASQLGKLQDWTEPLALGFRLRVLVPRYLILLCAAVLVICAQRSEGGMQDVFLFMSVLAIGIYIPVAWFFIFNPILATHQDRT